MACRDVLPAIVPDRRRNDAQAGNFRVRLHVIRKFSHAIPHLSEDTTQA